MTGKVAAILLLIYMAILVVMMAPLILLGFPGLATWDHVFKTWSSWKYWLWVVLMLLGEAALLFLPAKTASRRPVSTRSLLLPIVGSGVFACFLGMGMLMCLFEMLFRSTFIDKRSTFSLLALLAGIAIWVWWAVVFKRLTAKDEPSGALGRLQWSLFGGSVLALLVAVPTHILARQRNYCCAGMGTLVGIACGIAVLLASFGPGVFLLYVRRWKKLHPHAPAPADLPQPDNSGTGTAER